MSTPVACIAGEEIYRQWQTGRTAAQSLGARTTPFGPSGEIFFVDDADCSYYLLARHAGGIAKTAPRKVSNRANIYALKDLDVQAIIGWGAGGAITHNMAVGDLVVLNDLVDQTHMRDNTFFEDSPLGYIRQFPVFCPSLRRICDQVLHEMKLVYHGSGTAAVREGPRLETPAEVRMLSAIGTEIITHTFVPEMFLAKELEMCYAAICYVVNYAESGSLRQPFVPGGLFGGLALEGQRLAGAVGAMGRIVSAAAGYCNSTETTCDCDRTMADHIKTYDLPEDWRQWMR